MVNLFFKDRCYQIPESWNELSQKQLLKCADLLNKSFSEYTMLTSIFHCLAQMRAFTFFSIPKDKLYDCINLVSWIIQGVTLTEQRIPFYQGFYGPKKELENLRLKEFAMTELLYLQFRNDNNIDALNELISILYRPGKKGYNIKLDVDGDIRVAYNSHVVPFYKRKVSKWPIKVKLSIAFFYEGCRNNFTNNYKEVFEGESDGGETLPYGIWSIMRDVAEKGVFGDMEKVEDQYVDTLLMELHTQIIKAKEYERVLKSKI